jgi:hypothetical protein
MSYEENWRAWTAQIRGLQRAGELYAHFQAYRSEDSYSVGRFLGTQCGRAVEALETFRRTFARSLPTGVLCRLDELLAIPSIKVAKTGSSDVEVARGRSRCSYGSRGGGLISSFRSPGRNKGAL